MCASSSRDSNWFCKRTRLRLSWYFRWATVRQRRCRHRAQAQGQLLCHQPLHQPSASRKSFLRPAAHDSIAPAPNVAFPTSALHLPLLACRLPVPLQRAPDRCPICAVDSITISSTCCSMSHSDSSRSWSGLLLNCRPLKLVLAFAPRRLRPRPTSFYERQFRYPVRHKVPPGGSGERATRYLIQGRGLSPLPFEGETSPLFAQHARSGLDWQSASTALLLPQPRRSEPSHFASTLSNFHEVSRAEGPRGLARGSAVLSCGRNRRDTSFAETDQE